MRAVGSLCRRARRAPEPRVFAAAPIGVVGVVVPGLRRARALVQVARLRRVDPGVGRTDGCAGGHRKHVIASIAWMRHSVRPRRARKAVPQPFSNDVARGCGHVEWRRLGTTVGSAPHRRPGVTDEVGSVGGVDGQTTSDPAEPRSDLRASALWPRLGGWMLAGGLMQEVENHPIRLRRSLIGVARADADARR